MEFVISKALGVEHDAFSCKFRLPSIWDHLERLVIRRHSKANLLSFFLFPCLLLFLNQIELLQLFIAILVFLHVVIESLILYIRRLAPAHIWRSAFAARYSYHPDVRGPPLRALLPNALPQMFEARRIRVVFFDGLWLLIANVLDVDAIKLLLLHLLLLDQLGDTLLIFVVYCALRSSKLLEIWLNTGIPLFLETLVDMLDINGTFLNQL